MNESSRVVDVEVLLKLVAGAGGDFVNTWTRQFHLINDFAPVLYLAASDTDLLAEKTLTMHQGTAVTPDVVFSNMLNHAMFS